MIQRDDALVQSPNETDWKGFHRGKQSFFDPFGGRKGFHRGFTLETKAVPVKRNIVRLLVGERETRGWLAKLSLHFGIRVQISNIQLYLPPRGSTSIRSKDVKEGSQVRQVKNVVVG